MVVDMVATIAFFFLSIRAKVEVLSLSPQVECIIYNNLIPGTYLRLASARAKNGSEQKKLRSRSEDLLAPLLARDSPLGCLGEEGRSLIWRVSEECAHIFQRSSSCVEGRNGQLALRHHSLPRLRERKLVALTTVHNYFAKRSDGSTAAERFFGKRTRDLFEHILDTVNLPGWPAKKRPRPQGSGYPLQSDA